MIGENEALADYLVRQVPGFAESPELEAVGERDRSDVVAGALGRYLLRLERKAVRLEADPSESSRSGREATTRASVWRSWSGSSSACTPTT